MTESIPGAQTFQKRPSGGHKKASRNFKVLKENHDSCTQSTWKDKERIAESKPAWGKKKSSNPACDTE